MSDHACTFNLGTTSRNQLHLRESIIKLADKVDNGSVAICLYNIGLCF